MHGGILIRGWWYSSQAHWHGIEKIDIPFSFEHYFITLCMHHITVLQCKKKDESTRKLKCRDAVLGGSKVADQTGSQPWAVRSHSLTIGEYYVRWVLCKFMKLYIFSIHFFFLFEVNHKSCIYAHNMCLHKKFHRIFEFNVYFFFRLVCAKEEVNLNMWTCGIDFSVCILHCGVYLQKNAVAWTEKMCCVIARGTEKKIDFIY
jgi:hypothetical protein